jgi:hypothetical protein
MKKTTEELTAFIGILLEDEEPKPEDLIQSAGADLEAARSHLFQQFFGAYLTAALWSSTGGENGTESLDNYEWGEGAKEQLMPDALKFYQENYNDISDDLERAGHDFWLTRNGHGAGFWDGDWPEDVGERLTEISKRFREVELYLGDDERVYVY